MSSVTKSAGLATLVAGSDRDWYNPTNIYTQNYDLYNKNSTCTYTAFTSATSWIEYVGTKVLKATNFGFNIPNDQVISGIQVHVYKEGINTGSVYVKDNSVRLIINEVICGNDLKSNNYWPTTAGFVDYGSEINLWGNTLTPAIVNSANFGVSLSALLYSQTYSPAQAYIDYVSITVFYQPAVPNLKPRIDGAIKSMVSGSVRIDGALKTVDSIWARVEGALKKL